MKEDLQRTKTSSVIRTSSSTLEPPHSGHLTGSGSGSGSAPPRVAAALKSSCIPPGLPGNTVTVASPGFFSRQTIRPFFARSLCQEKCENDYGFAPDVDDSVIKCIIMRVQYAQSVRVTIATSGPLVSCCSGAQEAHKGASKRQNLPQQAV